jgi:hypothetical protein
MSNSKQDVKNEEPVTMQVVKNNAEETAQAEPVVETPSSQPELTLEQRIIMVEDLTMLIDKWRKLQESYRNLQSFKIGTDGMSTQIVPRVTTSGKEFKTSNTSVVARILEEIHVTLLNKITEVESQIRF